MPHHLSSRLIAAACLVAALSTEVLAAPNCKKGIPCGNTCIAANRTCRIESAPQPARPQAPRAAPSGAALWIASEADRVYFAPGCPAAADISQENRRVFRDEQSAAAAGYRRSRMPGC